jgi:hypothetical protein
MTGASVVLVVDVGVVEGSGVVDAFVVVRLLRELTPNFGMRFFLGNESLMGLKGNALSLLWAV